MTKDGFAQLVFSMKAYWPNMILPSEGEVAMIYEELIDISDKQAVAALKILSREGREFVPPVGIIVAKVLDLCDDTPDWGVAWKEIRDRVNIGSGSVYPEESWSHEVVFQTAKQIGMDEIGNAKRGDATFESQCRNVYVDNQYRWRESKRNIGVTGIESGKLIRIGGN